MMHTVMRTGANKGKHGRLPACLATPSTYRASRSRAKLCSRQGHPSKIELREVQVLSSVCAGFETK